MRSGQKRSGAGLVGNRGWGRWLKAVGLVLGLCGGGGCSGKGEALPPSGMNTHSQARRYVDQAVRRSTEGVILMPSRKAQTLFDQTRLNEIAQNLRGPAAVCFVNRAIETITRGEVDGEVVYQNVPEGQIRIRARINPTGEVLRTEVLETGFQDDNIYTCLDRAIKAIKWVENRSGVVQFIDVIYWVSLGRQQEDADEFRKQQAMVAVRASQCLSGRTISGRYLVEGLSLLDREGRTLANRIDPSKLPPAVHECVTVVFRDLRMPRVEEGFVRPVSPRVEFVVSPEGEVTFTDQRWLALLQLEAEALRAEQGEARSDVVSLGEDPVDEGLLEPEPKPDTPPPADPGEGGQKLRLGGLRDR